jgi:hypothetical protein
LVAIFGVTMSMNAYASYQEHEAHLAQYHAEATASAQRAAVYTTAQADATATAEARATVYAQEEAQETATATARSAEATVEAGKPLSVELCTGDEPECQHPRDNIVSVEQVSGFEYSDFAHLHVSGGAAMVGNGRVTLDAWKVDADGSRHRLPEPEACDRSDLVRDCDLGRDGPSLDLLLSEILPSDDTYTTVQTGTFIVDVVIGGQKLPPLTLTVTR